MQTTFQQRGSSTSSRRTSTTQRSAIHRAARSVNQSCGMEQDILLHLTLWHAEQELKSYYPRATKAKSALEKSMKGSTSLWLIKLQLVTNIQRKGGLRQKLRMRCVQDPLQTLCPSHPRCPAHPCLTSQPCKNPHMKQRGTTVICRSHQVVMNIVNFTGMSVLQ